MTYYDVNSFRWTEREYSLKEIVEEYSLYLPFVVLVTEGYSSRHMEITADQMFWIHEITRRPCVVVKDDQGRYFTLPESLQSKVIPLRKAPSGRFVPTSKPVHLSQLNERRWCQYFRLVESSSEVFDGLEDNQLMKIGCLEMLDIFQEKLLAGHPILSEPDTDSDDGTTGISEVNTGAVYPQVTLIPVYLPLVVRIALSTNNKSDGDFFKTMRQLKTLADSCCHDYKSLLESNAEIMMFNEAPTDHIYDYIQLKPFLQKSKNKISKEMEPYYTDIEDDSLDVCYEQIDDYSDTSGDDKNNKLRYREEPIVREAEIQPLERLIMLKDAYDKCSSESDSDYENPAPVLPPKYFKDKNNTPSVQQRNKTLLPPSASTARAVGGEKCRKDKIPVPGDHRMKEPVKSTAYPNEEPSASRLEANYQGRRYCIGSGFEVPKPPAKHVTKSKPKYKTVKPAPPPPTVARAGERAAGGSVSVTPNNSDPVSRTSGTPPRRPSNSTPSSSSSSSSSLGRGTSTQEKRTVPSPPAGPMSKSPETTRPGNNDLAEKEETEGSRITCISDIPADISELSVPRLMDTLHLLGMSKYVTAMKRSFVDGDLLCCLDEDTLVESFGFSNFDAKKLVRFCKGWRPRIE